MANHPWTETQQTPDQISKPSLNIIFPSGEEGNKVICNTNNCTWPLQENLQAVQMHQRICGQSGKTVIDIIFECEAPGQIGEKTPWILRSRFIKIP